MLIKTQINLIVQHLKTPSTTHNLIICAEAGGNSRERSCDPIIYAAFPLDELSINIASTFSIGYIPLTGNTNAFIEANCNNLSFG